MSRDTQIEQATKSAGAKFINVTSILIFVGIFGIFITYILVSAVMPTTHTNEEEETKQKSFASSIDSVKVLTANAGAGITPPEAPKVTGVIAPTTVEVNTKELKTEDEDKLGNTGQIQFKQLELDLKQPPTPDDVDLQLERQETAQIRQMKIELFHSAVRSSPKTNFSRATMPEVQIDHEARIASEQRELNAMRNGGANQMFAQRMAALKMNSTSGKGVNFGDFGNTDNTKIVDPEFRNPDPDRWTLNSDVQNPRTLSLLTGTVIPATLVTGINSDLPGQITAQISHNVYDTATGEFLLLPQGARLIGGYSSNIIYGQERVLLGWQRIIFPDGRSIDIGNMPGSDSAGYSGVTDEVNNHYARLFGASFMLSVISAGTAWAADRTSSDNDSTSFSNELASSAGAQMGQTSSELMRKNMNISPTLSVRPGFRINVIVTRDISFPSEYRDFEY